MTNEESELLAQELISWIEIAAANLGADVDDYSSKDYREAFRERLKQKQEDLEASKRRIEELEKQVEDLEQENEDLGVRLSDAEGDAPDGLTVAVAAERIAELEELLDDEFSSHIKTQVELGDRIADLQCQLHEEPNILSLRRTLSSLPNGRKAEIVLPFAEVLLRGTGTGFRSDGICEVNGFEVPEGGLLTAYMKVKGL